MSEIADQYRRFKEVGGVADLSDRVKLRLTGADRVRYLNGQVTANVQKLPIGETRPACVTTTKGRLCADVFIHATVDALFIDADAAVRETLPPRLERYIISDDATLDDVSDDLCLLHLLGTAADHPGLRETAIVFSSANRLGRPGFDAWLSADECERVRADLFAHFPVIEEQHAESLRIEAGVPRWGHDLDENTLPPEAGLERTHIDYAKGCYIGQEVISRLKSIGHVNRRLVGFTASGIDPLQPRMRLFSPGENSAEIGTLTSVGWSFALEKPVALGYLKRGSPMGELLAREAGDSGPGRTVFAQELPLIS